MIWRKWPKWSWVEWGSKVTVRITEWWEGAGGGRRGQGVQTTLFEGLPVSRAKAEVPPLFGFANMPGCDVAV